MGPTLAGRHRDEERAGRALDWLIYALVAVVIGVGALGAHDIVFKATGVSGQSRSAAQRVTDVFRPPFPGVRRVRILLMGADKRPGDKGRSDTLMVLSLNPHTKRAALLGIPRDLKVDIPGYGRDKINHSYHYGGVDLTKACVEDLIGDRIDHYALIYFMGFVKAVDRLGGVTVDVPDVEGQGRGMNYDEGVVVMRSHVDHNGYLHLHLSPGLQRLDGAAALGFVRYRKSTMYGDGRGNWAGDSDIARSGRQQQFLKAVAQQHVRVTNLHNLLGAASEAMKYVDSDLRNDWNTVYDLIRLVKEIDPDDLWTGTVPVGDSWEPVYYAILQQEQFAEMKLEMERHLDGVRAELGDIEVLNASGITGRAHDAAERLAAKGFSVTSVGNAETADLETTQILYSERHKRDARIAASVLACGELEAMGLSAAEAEAPPLQVMLGSDYDPDKAAAAAGQFTPDTQ